MHTGLNNFVSTRMEKNGKEWKIKWTSIHDDKKNSTISKMPYFAQVAFKEDTWLL